MSGTTLRLITRLLEDKNLTEEKRAELNRLCEEYISDQNEEENLRKQYEALPIKGQDEWVEVGEVGVDAGMVWMGDPCYILALPHCRQPSEEEKKKMIEDGSWDNLKDLYETPKELPKNLGESWHGFCDKMHNEEDRPIFGYASPEALKFYRDAITKGYREGQEAVQFNYDMGHAGLGVCMGSGYGDGSYPVYVKRNKEGRITEAKIVFISEEEYDEEEDYEESEETQG